MVNTTIEAHAAGDSQSEPVHGSSGGSLTAVQNERRILALTSAGHTLCHVSELVFAAVIVALMHEFRLAPDQVTRLAVPGFLLFGVGAVPAGLWTDRRSAREVLIVYFFLLATASCAVALVRSPTGLAVALAALGAALSLYHPAGLAMLSHGCQRRGRAMGINGIAGSLGVACGPYLGLLMVAMGNWRMAYWIIAGLSGAAGVLALLFRIDMHTETVVVKKHVAATTESRRIGWAAIGVLYTAMFLGGLNYRCMTTALPTLLSGGGEAADARVEPAAADVPGTTSSAVDQESSPKLKPRGHKAELVFFVLALGGIGQLVGGYAADKLKPPLLYMSFIAMTIPMALLMAHSSGWMTALAAMGLCLFMFAQQPVENCIVAQATPAKWRSTSYGLKFILTFGVGALGAQLTGVIWKRAGLAAVFDVFAVGALLMALCAALYWSLRPRQSD